MRTCTLLLLIFTALAVFCAAPCAQAIPAFARREHVVCQMCHFRPGELRPDGQQYLRRGLREEPPAKGPEASTVPAEHKRPLGEPLFLDLADYVSILGHHDFIAQTGARPEFDAGGIDLWFAGPINRNWTGLANPSFDIEEGGADVDSAYGQYVTRWSNRFGTGRFGQLLPYAILFNQGGPALPLSTPLVLSVPGDTGSSWTPTSFARGVELGGVAIERGNIYFGVGQPRMEDYQTSLPGFVNHTDVFAEAELRTGCCDSSITGYGYWGHAYLSPTATNQPFHRVGAFFNIYGPYTKGTVGFLTGSDEDEFGRSLGNSGFFALAEHLFSPTLSAYFRYDWFQRDLTVGGDETTSGPVIGASWWADTQVWITSELTFFKTTGEDRVTSFTTELTWAF